MNSEQQSPQENTAIDLTMIAACSFVMAAIMLAVALSYTRAIMIPFIVALFLSYFIYPVLEALQRRLHFPRWLAVICSLLLFALVLTGFGLLIRGSALKIIDSFYFYEEKLYRLTDAVIAFAARFNVKLDQATILSNVKQLPIFSYIQSAAGTAVTISMDILLILTFLIFLVSGRKSAVYTEPHNDDLGLGEAIDLKIRSYILTKVTTSLVTGVLVWITLAIMNLELSLMFGVLAFFLNFIPTLGSVIATLLPLPIALMQYEEGWKILTVLLIPAFLQLVIGNILEPKLIGRGLDLHPITILLSLMFWGLIWGLAGMFLAVPITAVLKIVLERIALTKGVSEMLAGRSVLYRKS